MNALQQLPMFEGGPMSAPVTPFAMPMGGAVGRCCPMPGQMPMMSQMPQMPMMPQMPQMPMMPQSMDSGLSAGSNQLTMLTQLLEMLTGLLTGMMLGQALRQRAPNSAGHGHAGHGHAGHGHAGHSAQGGSSPSAGAAASPATGADLSRSTPLGSAITRDAMKHTENISGLCLMHVGAVLRRHGIKCGPAHSAYMVGNQLASNKQMKEVQVPVGKLSHLPAGAVIVWDKGPNLPDGHISIALGDGREWSGPIRPQGHLGTHYRVFLPQ